MSLAGLPPIDQALLPADIRTAAPARKDAYEAGLGFERLLVAAAHAVARRTRRETRSAATRRTRTLLPDALTDGVMSGGGLGLARQLADAIDAQHRSAAR